MEKKQIKIRALEVDDLHRFISLLDKLIKSGDTWIGKIVSLVVEATKADEAKNDAENVEKYYALFSEIASKLITTYAEDVSGWFASLAGVSIEEYKHLPFDTDMVIIEQFKEADEFKSFFSKACAVFNLKKKLGDLMSKAKTGFVSLTN
jgi:hypothetical protein